MGSNRINGHAKGSDGAELGLTANEREVLFSFVTNELTTRAALFQSMTNPLRDLDKELGYPLTVSDREYYRWYEREGLATRIVNLWPSEVWKVSPKIFEKESNAVTTEFEKDWEAFARQWHPWSYLKRADEQSRIGRFGVLLIGFDDDKPLDQIVAGVTETGERMRRGRRNRVLYLKVFAEQNVTVASLQTNPRHPRYSQVQTYKIKFADTDNPGRTKTETVHWSRVIHLAANRRESDIYGAPQMQNSYNRLLDVKKTLGGSAEMFWRGAFAGLSIESPAPTTGTNASKFTEAERKKLRAEIEAYANGLQRYMALVGMSAKSLAPQVADPTNHVDAQLKMIAVAMNVPVRMLMGAEAGEKASTQDRKNWNDRVTGEANGYTSPFVVIPFVHRLIIAGVLTAPAKDRLGYYDFKAEWPDLNAPTPNEIAEIAQRLAASMKDYMLSGTWKFIDPKDWFIEVWRMDPKLAKLLPEAGKKFAKANPQLDEIIAGKGQAPGGTGGKTNTGRSSGVRGAGKSNRPAAPAEASAGARA
jgi:hypothetical protein